MERQENGWYCKWCIKYSGKIDERTGGAWVTNPIPKGDDRLYQKADKHAESKAHKFAKERASVAAAFKTNVADMVRIQAAKESDEKEEAHKSLLILTYYLVRNDIPHTLNLRELCSAVTCFTPSENPISNVLRSAPANAHHLSSKSATSFLEALADAAYLKVIADFNEDTKYSLMADEATDSSNITRLSVCVRFLKDTEVIERFLACVPLQATNAKSIKEGIDIILDKYSLSIQNCVSVAFDGAANFAGKKSGVQALMKADKSTDHLCPLSCTSTPAQSCSRKQTMRHCQSSLTNFDRSVLLGVRQLS